jgi:hypothetical protein
VLAAALGEPVRAGLPRLGVPAQTTSPG